MIIKKALPDMGELVIAEIKKVMPYGAYCHLKDYDIDAYLPINEVASGWIKNIREFIREGQVRVAKVIFVDGDKRAVDISFKKVSNKESRDKLSEDNLENRARNMLNTALAQANLTDKSEEIKAQLAQKFTNYSDIVDAVLASDNALADINVSEDFKRNFYEIVHKNIKPKTYTVSYTAEIVPSNININISKIKKILNELKDAGVEIQYLGAPRYKLVAKGDSYPNAEAKIKKANEILAKYADEVQVTIEKEKQ